MEKLFKDRKGALHSIDIKYSHLLPEGCVLLSDEEGQSLLYHEPTTEQIIAQYSAAVQQRLDCFARTRNYDSILSAASYAISTNPKFAAEGQYAVAVRDATWAKCYEILEQVQSGTRPMPTLDELMEELPVLQWPNEPSAE